MILFQWWIGNNLYLSWTREGFTGAHVDNVYMGRGTSELLTMWVHNDQYNMKVIHRTKMKQCSETGMCLSIKVDTVWRCIFGHGLFSSCWGKPCCSRVQASSGWQNDTQKVQIVLGWQRALVVRYSSLPLRCLPNIFSLKELSSLPALSEWLCVHFYIRPKVRNS